MVQNTSTAVMQRRVRVLPGDCVRAMQLMAARDIKVDSIVTDPPYHFGSIVKRFAKSGGDRLQSRVGAYTRHAKGFMGKTWDGGDIAFQPETWEAALNVLKPGGHLLAFAGTRGYHRMICAIEDAGFEIRDCVAWLYGSGFPKSHNQHGDWEGWGTALKPAWEPICVARKPLVGTVAANLAAHGVGALNIDGCRIFGPDEAVERDGEPAQDRRYTENGGTNFAAKPGRRYRVKRMKPGATLEKTGGNWRPDDGPMYEGEMKPGRWPANVLHDGSEEVLDGFPAEAGAAAPVHKRNGDKFRNTYGALAGNTDEAGSTFRGDNGSAARFFYTAKADAEDRLGSKHPTVKPVDLMRYLCRLVTPPGGLVLDPFAGSGTTGSACLAEGFRAILCEREAEYLADIRRRIAHVAGGDTPLFADAEASKATLFDAAE